MSKEQYRVHKYYTSIQSCVILFLRHTIYAKLEKSVEKIELF